MAYIQLSKSQKVHSLQHNHCVKRDPIRSFTGPHFPAFELNTEIYSVNLRIQSESGKMRIRKTQNTDYI